MGTSNFQFTEPAEALKQKIGKMEFTLWDSFEFKNCTLQIVIDYFKNKYNLHVTGFTVGQLMLLSSFMPLVKQNDRKKKKFDEVYKELADKEPENPLVLSVIIDSDTEDEDQEDENQDQEMPTIKIKF